MLFSIFYKKYKLNIVVFVLVNILFSSCNQSQRDIHPKELIGGFELLKPDQIGVDFNNLIKEKKYFSHYFFGQTYVGVGISIWDLDNDGLPDIFFSDNQVGDRLYPNKGNFKVEDISKSSKIYRNPVWIRRVTMADGNADGFLDIYVSRNGNSLDINKKGIYYL
jgi:hypothetical protein